MGRGYGASVGGEAAVRGTAVCQGAGAGGAGDARGDVCSSDEGAWNVARRGGRAENDRFRDGEGEGDFPTACEIIYGTPKCWVKEDGSCEACSL